jgi:transposase
LLTSKPTRERAAPDLGVGKSMLCKWLSQYRPGDLVSAPQADLACANERLRFESRVLKEGRDTKKSHAVPREPTAMGLAPKDFWHGELAPCLARGSDLPCHAGKPARIRSQSGVLPQAAGENCYKSNIGGSAHVSDAFLITARLL